MRKNSCTRPWIHLVKRRSRLRLSSTTTASSSLRLTKSFDVLGDERRPADHARQTADEPESALFARQHLERPDERALADDAAPRTTPSGVPLADAPARDGTRRCAGASISRPDSTPGRVESGPAPRQAGTLEPKNGCHPSGGELWRSATGGGVGAPARSISFPTIPVVFRLQWSRRPLHRQHRRGPTRPALPRPGRRRLYGKIRRLAY